MRSIIKFPHRELSASGSVDDNAGRDAVVLLHGLFATRRSMAKAQRRLLDAGYLAINWGYPTFVQKLERFAKPLVSMLNQLENDEHIRSVSFLTHSFGAIVTRYVLNQLSFQKARRVVMLAPPNAGSSLTKIKLGPFRYLCPTIDDISLKEDSLANRLGSPESVEVGIIAAKSDFVVPLASTNLTDQADHCVVASTHFALPNNEDALSKALNFLRFGKFVEAAPLARAA